MLVLYKHAAAVSVWVQRSNCVMPSRHCFIAILPASGHYNLSIYSSTAIYKVWRSVHEIDVPFIAKHSIATYSTHLSKLWVSALNNVQCTKKFLWWGLRTLIYELWYKNLQYSSILGPFSYIVVASPPLGLVIMSCWKNLWYQRYVFSCRFVLK